MLEKYRKTSVPSDPRSLLEYLNQQLVSIERSLNDLVPATEQLQTDVGNLETPIVFRAYQNTPQSINNGIQTKLVFDVEEFDPDGCFDLANDKFIPNVAGYYLIGGTVTFSSITGSNNATELYKNGSVYTKLSQGAIFAGQGSTIVYANGTTDYFELYALHNTGGSLNTSGNLYTVFWGHLVRPA